MFVIVWMRVVLEVFFFLMFLLVDCLVRNRRYVFVRGGKLLKVGFEFLKIKVRGFFCFVFAFCLCIMMKVFIVISIIVVCYKSFIFVGWFGFGDIL